jgi:hypothetical protein
MLVIGTVLLHRAKSRTPPRDRWSVPSASSLAAACSPPRGTRPGSCASRASFVGRPPPAGRTSPCRRSRPRRPATPDHDRTQGCDAPGGGRRPPRRGVRPAVPLVLSPVDHLQDLGAGDVVGGCRAARQTVLGKYTRNRGLESSQPLSRSDPGDLHSHAPTVTGERGRPPVSRHEASCRRVSSPTLIPPCANRPRPASTGSPGPAGRARRAARSAIGNRPPTGPGASRRPGRRSTGPTSGPVRQ